MGTTGDVRRDLIDEIGLGRLQRYAALGRIQHRLKDLGLGGKVKAALRFGFIELRLAGDRQILIGADFLANFLERVRVSPDVKQLVRLVKMAWAAACRDELIS